MTACAHPESLVSTQRKLIPFLVLFGLLLLTQAAVAGSQPKTRSMSPGSDNQAAVGALPAPAGLAEPADLPDWRAVRVTVEAERCDDTGTYFFDLPVGVTSVSVSCKPAGVATTLFFTYPETLPSAWQTVTFTVQAKTTNNSDLPQFTSAWAAEAPDPYNPYQPPPMECDWPGQVRAGPGTLAPGQSWQTFKQVCKYNTMRFAGLPEVKWLFQGGGEGYQNHHVWVSVVYRQPSNPSLQGRAYALADDGATYPLIGVPVTLLQGGAELRRAISQPPDGHYALYDVPAATSLVLSTTLQNAAVAPPTFQVVYSNTVSPPPLVYVATDPFTIPAGASSYGRDVVFARRPDFTTDPAIPPGALDDLGVIYYHVHQAWELADRLGLVLSMKPPVDIRAFSNDSGVFWEGPLTTNANVAQGDPFINLEAAGGSSDYTDGGRPDNREWHEFGHHVMADALGDLMPDDPAHCPNPPAAGADCNHWGYSNATTTDSWTEGFAEFYSLMVGKEIALKAHPELYRWMRSDSNLESNYLAWDGQNPAGGDEEFAVAGLLWDLADPADADDGTFLGLGTGSPDYYADCVQGDLNSLWSILSKSWGTSVPKSPLAPASYGYVFDIKHLYDVLQAQGIGAAHSRGGPLTDLQELFVAHGFFADTGPGDRIYRPGEEIGRAADAARPGRRNRPPTHGSYIAFSATDAQTGAPVSVQDFQVAVRFDPPFAHYSYSYRTNTAALPGRLYLPAQSSQYRMTTYITALAPGRIATEPLAITNAFYQQQMATSPTDHFMQHGFVMRKLPAIYLPMVARGGGGSAANTAGPGVFVEDSLLGAASANIAQHTPPPCGPDTGTRTPTPTATASATATATLTPSATATRTITPSPTVTPSATPSPTATPTGTRVTDTPTATATATGSPTVTATPTATRTGPPITDTPTPTATQSATPTVTRTATATWTATPTSTRTPTATATTTPTPTRTPTATVTVPSLTCDWLDDFAGPPLDPGWAWVREDNTHWSLLARPGFMRITTETGDLTGATDTARNLLLRIAPSGDFTVTTLLEFSPGQEMQQAGLLLYVDDANYLRLSRLRQASQGGDAVQLAREIGGVVTTQQIGALSTRLYLRLNRTKRDWAAAFSLDGALWTEVGHLVAVPLAAPRLGLAAWNGAAPLPEIPADFDWVCVDEAPGSIYGKATYHNTPATGLRVDLLRWDGADWLTQATATTAADGGYLFSAPTLAAGQTYAVNYENTNADPNPGPGYLWNWWGDRITSYTAGAAAWGGDFDVADIPLVSPADAAAVTLPAQFCWTRRGVPGDNYRLALYNWLTDETARTAYLGDVACATLTGLPAGWPSGETYTWWVEVGQGAQPGATPYNYGASQSERLVTINHTAAAAKALIRDVTAAPADYVGARLRRGRRPGLPDQSGAGDGRPVVDTHAGG